MTLVDTSVWVTAKRGSDSKLTSTLRNLVAADQVLGHELVYLEMVLGEGGDTRRQLLDDYGRLQTAEALPSSEVARFCRTHRLANRGIGAVDAHILAAAHAHGATVWTLDRAMAKASAALQLGFAPLNG